MSVDTPDFQRGVVSAQKLLATVPAGSTFVDVGVPPNAESLMVAVPAAANASEVVVAGKATGLFYTGRRLQSYDILPPDPTWVFDISAALDPTVTVSIAMENAKGWYVYTDSAIHMQANTPALADKRGVQYTTLVAPDLAAGDPLPVELQQVAATINSSTAPTIVPAPPAGQRIRLFGVNAGAAQTWLALGPFGVGSWFVCTANTTLAVQLLPSGVPLPAATAFEITGAGAAGATGIAGATYTIESV